MAVRARTAAAAALLSALMIAWAALPVAGARAGTRITIILSAAFALASAARLAVGGLEIGGDAFDPPLVRLAAAAAQALRAVPWPELLIITVLGLEALHHSRAWHTALLGVVLLAYLFATHLAETRARPAVLIPQLPVIVAGLGLLALAVGVAALPRLETGPAADLLRLLAVVAAVIAGGLALPTQARSTDGDGSRAPGGRRP